MRLSVTVSRLPTYMAATVARDTCFARCAQGHALRCGLALNTQKKELVGIISAHASMQAGMHAQLTHEYTGGSTPGSVWAVTRLGCWNRRSHSSVVPAFITPSTNRGNG